MSKAVTAHIFRVFTNKEGKFGNPVGIIVDEKQEIASQNRQHIATRLGFSESVFINDLDSGGVSIFNPINEVNFAGHALVGTAYFTNKILGKSISSLDCKGGKISTWQDGNLTWISAGLEGTPPWQHEQFPDAASVKKFSVSKSNPKKHTMIWAWIDKNKGIIKARTFAPDWGIPEDEANGSGSMQLAATLGQKLEIHHGKGSIIYAKPANKSLVSVGGRVTLGRRRLLR